MVPKERITLLDFSLFVVNPGLNARSLKSTLEDSPEISNVPGIQRNAVKQPYLKWRSAKIPYTISKQYTTFGYNCKQKKKQIIFCGFRKDRIAEALEEYRIKTCVEFQPKTEADTDYVKHSQMNNEFILLSLKVHIFPDDGCYSLVGKVGQ